MVVARREEILVGIIRESLYAPFILWVQLADTRHFYGSTCFEVEISPDLLYFKDTVDELFLKSQVNTL